MKPLKLKQGDKLLIKGAFEGQTETAFFIRRIPAEAGRKAINYLRFPGYAGVNGPDDNGTCEMTDYDLSRLGEYA